MHLDFRRCFDTDSDLVTLYTENGDGDGITDDKLLSYAPCQNKHNNLPLVSDTSCIRALIVFYAYAKTICETLNSGVSSSAATGPFPSFYTAEMVSCFR
jgi:hypothetical protein